MLYKVLKVSRVSRDKVACFNAYRLNMLIVVDNQRFDVGSIKLVRWEIGHAT